MRDSFPFIASLKQFFIFDIHITNPELSCKVFTYSQSFIAMAQSKHFLQRKKHIVIKYHHFRIFVQNKLIWIGYIGTMEQTADIFTIPLGEVLCLSYNKYQWLVNHLIRQEGVLES